MSGNDTFRIDLYASGSCVYLLDHKGEVESLVAWARSTIVASRAFAALVDQYPTQSFCQRRRSHVENERIAPAPDPSTIERVSLPPVDTIAQHIAQRDSIRAYCERPGEPRCGHSTELDLDSLVRRLGYDHSTMHKALAPKLRCSACGSRQVSLRIAPFTNPPR